MAKYKMVICRRCRQPVLWSVDEGGNTVPLQPAGPVYQLKRVMAHGPAGPATAFAIQIDDLWVDHRPFCKQ